MKIGIRKPSFSKSLAARTTGRLNRQIKKSLIPGYSRKGMGKYHNPKKAIYNRAYNRCTTSLFNQHSNTQESAENVSERQNSKISRIVDTMNNIEYVFKTAVFLFFYGLGFITLSFLAIRIIFKAFTS